MKADIVVNPDGTGTLALDGVQVESVVSAIQLNVRGHGKQPTLTLDLVIQQVAAFGADVEAHLSDEARNLLIRLGWTPPPDPAPPTRTEAGAVRSPEATG